MKFFGHKINRFGSTFVAGGLVAVDETGGGHYTMYQARFIFPEGVDSPVQFVIHGGPSKSLEEALAKLEANVQIALDRLKELSCG